MSRQPSARPLVRFGVFELDVSAGELRKQGRKINLQQQPFQVLALLLRRPGELVTREELQQELWPADTFVEFDQGLNTAIKKIRQALDDSADRPRFVETLPRKGYRFIAAVNGGESGGEGGRESSGGSSTPPTVRGSRPLWAAAALALAVAAGVAWWLLNQRNETKRSETAAAAFVPVPLTSYSGRESGPSFSPDGNQVAFDWENPGGQPGIYIKLVGEGEPVRLTGGCCPSWSPDGRYIAFLKFEPRPGVFLIPSIGGPERNLTELSGFQCSLGMAWHGSGKWLIVTGKNSPGEPQALFLLSSESGAQRRLTFPPPGSQDMSPALSPGGEAVVFSRLSAGQWHLFLLELSENLQPKEEPRRITRENTYNNEPAWTPDGQAIVFTSGTIHTCGLYEMQLSRPGWRPGKPRRLPFAGEGVRTPVLSKQGRLAYAGAWTTRANIWRIALNGGLPVTAPPQRLIHSTRLDHVAEYSPDGKRIAFASNRSGSHEIWVCNSDGSGARQLTSLGGSFYTADPHWSPDGRLILFHSNPEGHAQTYVIDSDGGKPELLFANSTVSSWSRDRKWIYIHRTGENQVWKRPWPPSGQDGEPVKITRHGGDFALESPDGRVLYYQKGEEIEDVASLWKVPVDGGEETQVLESICILDFAVVDQGIYFISALRPGDQRKIQFLSFATGQASTIATISYDAAYGFSLSPDGQWLLYSQFEPEVSDLSMVENFR